MHVPLVLLVIVAFVLSCYYDNTAWWQHGGFRMASFVPPLPPEKFNFAHPDAWLQWIKWFELYRVASGLSNRDSPVQASTLIYAMEEEAEEIFTSFESQEEDRSNYNTVNTVLWSTSLSGTIQYMNLRALINESSSRGDCWFVLIGTSFSCWALLVWNALQPTGQGSPSFWIAGHSSERLQLEADLMLSWKQTSC